MPVRILKVSISSAGRADGLSDRVFSEVNRYRANKGAGSLRRSAGLDRLAREHAGFLSLSRAKAGLHGTLVNHHGFESRASRARYSMNFGRVAENVVSCNSTSAATLVRLWSGSKPHEITMRGDYQYTGIGTVIDSDGMVFSVELFGAVPNWR
jgi:uncharacterized protein YkwD